MNLRLLLCATEEEAQNALAEARADNDPNVLGVVDAGDGYTLSTNCRWALLINLKD